MFSDEMDATPTRHSLLPSHHEQVILVFFLLLLRLRTTASFTLCLISSRQDVPGNFLRRNRRVARGRRPRRRRRRGTITAAVPGNLPGIIVCASRSITTTAATAGIGKRSGSGKRSAGSRSVTSVARFVAAAVCFLPVDSGGCRGAGGGRVETVKIYAVLSLPQRNGAGWSSFAGNSSSARRENTTTATVTPAPACRSAATIAGTDTVSAPTRDSRGGATAFVRRESDLFLVAVACQIAAYRPIREESEERGGGS